jgi:hypothetical protein
MDISEAEFRAANERAVQRQAAEPIATAARYDRRTGRVVITLSNGLELGFRPHDAQGLENARPAQLAVIEISPSGQGLHVPALDADLYLPALLQGLLGSPDWMSQRRLTQMAAAKLGTAGGRVRSAAKAEAARTNGKLGGRPRKAAAKTRVL